MFATRLFARPAAKVCVLSLAVATWANAAAEAAVPASGWQAAGSSGSARSSAASSQSGDAWRLPNGQVVPAAQTTKQPPAANSLRQSGQPVTSLREPRAMSAPANAKPIAAAKQNSASAKQSASVQQHSPSAAIAQTAAFVPARRPANTANRPMMQQQPATPRIARAMPPRPASNPNTNRMWQRMNVAMNDAEWSGESEDLPLPGPTMKSNSTGDPFGSDPNGYYLHGDEQYSSCGPDGCGDGCCGPDGCGDGCCEPGCGCGDGCCEPGCGCGCGSQCGDECVNDCLAIGPGDDESCHQVRLRVPRWQELAVFAGVQGFKNPYDQDRDPSNFGFHEGFNAGFKIPYTWIGYQVGYQSTQSQLNGTENPDSGKLHTQHFTTFGLFRRCDDGLQFGSAWDTLVDRRFHARTFHQIRTEISWVDSCCHEFGVSGTVGVLDHEDPDDDEITWEASDQYVLFYRFHGKHGGEGRFYGGWTDDSDGILGADMLIPVHDRWSVQSGFTYMIPDSRNGPDGANDEAWNINLAMVWHWGCRARTSHDNPYRPLFNVANNGYMIIDSRDND